MFCIYIILKINEYKNLPLIYVDSLLEISINNYCEMQIKYYFYINIIIPNYIVKLLYNKNNIFRNFTALLIRYYNKMNLQNRKNIFIFLIIFFSYEIIRKIQFS